MDFILPWIILIFDRYIYVYFEMKIFPLSNKCLLIFFSASRRQFVTLARKFFSRRRKKSSKDMYPFKRLLFRLPNFLLYSDSLSLALPDNLAVAYVTKWVLGWNWSTLIPSHDFVWQKWLCLAKMTFFFTKCFYFISFFLDSFFLLNKLLLYIWNNSLIEDNAAFCCIHAQVRQLRERNLPKYSLAFFISHHVNISSHRRLHREK